MLHQHARYLYYWDIHIVWFMYLYFVPGDAMNHLQVDFESSHWLVLIPTKTMTQGRSSPIRAFVCNGKNNQYQYEFFCSVDIVPRNSYSTHCLKLSYSSFTWTSHFIIPNQKLTRCVAFGLLHIDDICTDFSYIGMAKLGHLIRIFTAD